MKNDNKIDLEDLPIEVLFKYLLRDYKAAKVEIGVLQSENEELKYQLKEAKKPQIMQVYLKDIPKGGRKEYMMAYYEQIGLKPADENLHGSGLKGKRLKLAYDDLLCKYIKVSNELQTLKGIWYGK